MSFGFGLSPRIGGAGALGPPAVWYEDNTLVLSSEHGRTIFLGTQLQRGYGEQRSPNKEFASFMAQSIAQINSKTHTAPNFSSFLGTTFSSTNAKTHPGTTYTTFLGTSFSDVNHQPHSGATFQ